MQSEFAAFATCQVYFDLAKISQGYITTSFFSAISGYGMCVCVGCMFVFMGKTILVISKSLFWTVYRDWHACVCVRMTKIEAKLTDMYREK